MKQLLSVRVGLMAILLTMNAGVVWGQLPQNTAFNTRAAAESHRANYAEVVKKKNLRANPDYYYRLKINVDQMDRLKAAGVDLLAMDGRVGGKDYKENVALTDDVIQGSIISREDDSSSTVAFHAAYVVKVAEVVAGNASTKTITVKLRSGRRGNGIMSVSHEPELSIGEHVLLYVYSPDTAGIRAPVPNIGPNEFLILAKYTVRNGYAFQGGNRKIDTVAAMKRRIRKIASILDKDNFYLHSFQ